MKAILLTGPGAFELTHIPKPLCDAKGIIVKVKACGLCGSDLRTLFSGHKNVVYPWVIGHEVCGIVDELGSEYEGLLKVGAVVAIAPPVYCGVCEHCISGKKELCMNMRELAQQWHGGFAEYMHIPREALSNGCIVPMDSSSDYAEIAIAEPPSSCINAHEKLNTGINDTVLIIGAGPVGCLHISVAKARGAKRIFVADISDYRLEKSKLFGDITTINTLDNDLVETVLLLTDGIGADVVITANPVGETQTQAIDAVKKGGRIAFFGGLPHGKSTPKIDTNKIHYKGITIIGTTNFAPRHHRTAIEMILDGRIPAEKLITHRLSIDGFDKGVSAAKEGEALKVVFEFD